MAIVISIRKDGKRKAVVRITMRDDVYFRVLIVLGTSSSQPVLPRLPENLAAGRV